MANRYAELAFTPAIKAMQEKLGSRKTYERVEQSGNTNSQFGLAEKEFISTRDSFYMASVSETGWPYVQFRGGPPGFLKVIDDHTVGFVDFRGNRQYISVGNLSRDDRVSLILMDYPSRTRLKIMGRMEVHDGADSKPLIETLRPPNYKAAMERAMLIHLEAFDWNCPQHITPRYTEGEIRTVLEPLTTRLQVLERENKDLRERLQKMGVTSSGLP
ncbi:MAG: pyridoxamine 5'-phosphate oxidase family protein [Bryobacteraceae bacterium]